MRQKDLAILVGVLIISVIVAVSLSRVLFDSSKYQKQVAVVDQITPDFPDQPVQGKNGQFNASAFNPAQLIRIGQPNNHPFSTSPQGQ